MLFLQYSLAVAAILAINVFALPVETVQDDQSPSLDRILFSRSLPPCPAQRGRRFEAIMPREVRLDAGKSLRSRVTYDRAGWKHPICGYYRVNCYSIQQYMRFTGSEGDIGRELGHWYGNDGSELFAFDYWHNELGFSGTGGSAKIYPAHDTFFICVSGYFNVVIEFPQNGDRGQGGSDTLYGNSKTIDADPDGWNGPCKCYGSGRWDIYGSDIRIEWRR